MSADRSPLISLPASGFVVALDAPRGVDDLILLEWEGSLIGLALTLARRLARPVDRAQIDWETLPATDLERLMLELRRRLIGDRIHTDTRCRHCGERVDIDFRISDYLSFRQPRLPRGLQPGDQPGWFGLTGSATRFRLPTVADQLAAERQPEGDRLLLERCVLPIPSASRARSRIEAAMEKMAPSCSGVMESQCPECGGRLEVFFDALAFPLAELKNHAAILFDEVHLLASHYRWGEEEILAMPSVRRAQYVQRLSFEGGLV